MCIRDRATRERTRDHRQQRAEAEVARLRRVESCAVAYLEAWDADDDGTVELHALRSTREALRAALKEGKSDG